MSTIIVIDRYTGMYIHGGVLITVVTVCICVKVYTVNTNMVSYESTCMVAWNLPGGGRRVWLNL